MLWGGSTYHFKCDDVHLGEVAAKVMIKHRL